MPLKTSQDDELPVLNLTSMIDVVFLLLIFFMVATKFSEAQLPVELKMQTSGLQANLGTDPRRVIVGIDGRVSLDGQAVSLQELTGKLRELRGQFPGLIVEVQGEPKASYESVWAAYSAIRSANVEMRAGVSNALR